MQIRLRKLARVVRRRSPSRVTTALKAWGKLDAELAATTQATRADTREPTDPTTVDDDAIQLVAVRKKPGEFQGRSWRLSASTRQWLSRRTYLVPVAIAIVVGVISMINHFSGVDWGDDFALYIRQARALVTGTVGDVIRDNRFTVDHSGWHTFSPYSYPWGWPLLIAPMYALFGLNYEALKFLEVVALCVFLLVFFAIVRRRAGLLPATLLTLLIGFSPVYVGSTDTVLSDLPYLCFVGLSLWWMDRCRLHGLFAASWQRLVTLGLLLAFTFNIRPEGISVVLCLVSLHVAVLAGTMLRARSQQVLRSVRWGHVLLPYMAMVLGIMAFQVLLPGTLLPRAPGAGLQNAPAHAAFYQDIIAENVGLKRAGMPMELWHSEAAARSGVVLLVILAIIGLIARLLKRFEEDVALAACLCCTALIMFISPYQEGRYLLTITPLLAYFAYQALPTIAGWASSLPGVILRFASVAPALALAGLVGLNARTLAESTRYHLDYHYTVNGPEAPDAREMISAVRHLTQTDDVILFFRARAMTLYSDRRAIQGSNLDELLKEADWYVMAKDSTYSQALLTDAGAATYGLTKAWENSKWVVWRVPPRFT